FFHGGGFTMGGTRDHLELLAQLVTQTDAAVLSVDYRLLPTYQFPAPLEDAKAAYRWLLDKGYQSENIGLMGISSGASLLLQLILLCEKEALPMPKWAVAMSSLGNLQFDFPSLEYNSDRDWITA